MAKFGQVPEIECPVVGCNWFFKDVDRFIDHIQKVHVPEFERQQNPMSTDHK